MFYRFFDILQRHSSLCCLLHRMLAENKPSYHRTRLQTGRDCAQGYQGASPCYGPVNRTNSATQHDTASGVGQSIHDWRSLVTEEIDSVSIGVVVRAAIRNVQCSSR